MLTALKDVYADDVMCHANCFKRCVCRWCNALKDVYADDIMCHANCFKRCVCRWCNIPC